MRKIELIALGLNEIARECHIIDDVMVECIRAAAMQKTKGNTDGEAFFNRIAEGHQELLKEVYEKVRDLLEFVGEYMNGQDMVSPVDLAINKAVYDLVYERTTEKDYEASERPLRTGHNLN